MSQPNSSQPSADRELPPPPPKNAPPLTVIADGTNVGGHVNVTGDLRVDGSVEGALLSAGGSCEISLGGAVHVESARAVSLVVHGKLRATEVVARRVTVMSSGELLAHVVAAEAVEVEDGGKLGAALEIGSTEGR